MWSFFIFQLLESVIRSRIPSILSLINKNIEELERELDQLGRPVAIDAGVSTYILMKVYEFVYFCGRLKFVGLRLNYTLSWECVEHSKRYSKSIWMAGKNTIIELLFFFPPT